MWVFSMPSRFLNLSAHVYPRHAGLLLLLRGVVLAVRAAVWPCL